MNPLNNQTSEIAAAYERYADMLFRVAYSELLSKEDAEDTISEVFFKFMRKKPEFQDAEHEKAWFIRVTINQCHDMQRKRVIRSYTPLDEIAEIPSVEKAEHFILEDVLALPEKYKLVLILFYFEELKIEEIATAMKLSQAAVKMRLNRAREYLKKRIER